MPNNNDLFNINDLPKRNEDNQLPKQADNSINQNAQIQNQQPINNQINTAPQTSQNNIIEIPQAYYDKLAKEEEERQKKAVLEAEKKQEAMEAKKSFNNFSLLIAINAIVIFVCLYLMININQLAIFVIPIYIIVLTIFFALKHKKNSSYPASVIVGSIIIAVVTFIISMLKEEEMDLWTYYSVASVIIGFIGLITSNILTKIISSPKEIKALEYSGYFIYFACLIGIPIFLEIKYPTEFHQYVFMNQIEVKAETEEEFIIKTLKIRYNDTFTCDNSNIKYQVDEHNRAQNVRTCKSSSGKEFNVISKDYNELNNQYIIIENYIDTLFLTSTKEQIVKALATNTMTDTVELYMYPETNCTFYGDCADCDEYYQRYSIETSVDNQFKESTALNFSKSMNLDSKTFINNNKFKYVINIKSSFDEFNTDYNLLVSKVLDYLNNNGYKNTFGYIISIYSNTSSSLGDTSKLVFKVKGNSNEEQTFKDPEVVDINAYKSNK